MVWQQAKTASRKASSELAIVFFDAARARVFQTPNVLRQLLRAAISFGAPLSLSLSLSLSLPLSAWRRDQLGLVLGEVGRKRCSVNSRGASFARSEVLLHRFA